MDSYKSFRFAHRTMQVGIAVACLLMVFTLYSHQRNAERDNQIVIKHNELIISSQKTLDEVRRQNTAAKELLAAAQSRLTATESRRAAEEAKASQSAQ